MASVHQGFRDRREAGDRLADELQHRGEIAPGAIVLGLPRGGVVVAERVASRFDLELDVLVARKVGAPGHPEFGIGAVAEGGALVLDDESVHAVGVRPDELRALVEAERRRVDERVARYRATRPRVPLAGRRVIVVDDGFATGVTARAALAAVRDEGPSRLVLAVPVAAPDAPAVLDGAADAFVVVLTPPGFRAVGEFYARFDQTTDDEVIALLAGR
jgi:putative phosphoribosyl transferase